MDHKEEAPKENTPKEEAPKGKNNNQAPTTIGQHQKRNKKREDAPNILSLPCRAFHVVPTVMSLPCCAFHVDPSILDTLVVEPSVVEPPC